MGVSCSEAKIGIALGQLLIKNQKEICSLAFYKRNKVTTMFELEKDVAFDFKDACIQFTFCHENDNSILFFEAHRLFKYNYLTEEVITVYEIQNKLEAQPNFGIFNHNQTKFIVTSSEDILYCDMKKSLEIDLDERENISSLQNIIQDNKYFYILANKKESRLGMYLLKVNINDPDEESEYLINWTNKLDIGNCDLFMLKQTKTENPCIVISFKSIGINTYNVFVIDLDTSLIKYWHECFQLWESEVKGFLLSTNDFMILSKDGMNLLALGEK